MTDKEKSIILRCLFRASLAYREDALSGAPEASARRAVAAEEAHELAFKLKAEGWKM